MALLPYVASRPVSAAGSAAFTAETNTNSAQTGNTFEIRFYVTTSGANIYSGDVYVTLTNSVFNSYSAVDTDFNGISSTMGGQNGSTSFQIVAGYNGTNSGSGKLYIGKVIATGTSVGTATINLYNPSADDANLAPMSASSQDKTVSVTAPPSSGGSPTCPSGQVGTPPNCSAPQAPSTDKSTTRNTAATSPNPDSNVALPGSNDDPTAPPDIVAEPIFAADAASELTDQPAAGDSKKASRTKLLVAGLAGVVALAAAGFIGFKVFKHRRQLLSYWQHHDSPKPPSDEDAPSTSQQNTPPPETVINPDQAPETEPPEQSDDDKKSQQE